MENVTYNYIPNYGICESFGSLYSLSNDVNRRSYFLVLPIKDLMNEDGKTTTSFKTATGTKPSVSHLCVLFCACVVQKSNEHVGTKALNMHHQSQNCF